jgi:hypothetical protein
LRNLKASFGSGQTRFRSWPEHSGFQYRLLRSTRNGPRKRPVPTKPNDASSGLETSLARGLTLIKVCLIWFENFSGMRINFNKSEFIPLNLYEDETHRVGHILGCPKGGSLLST